MREKIDLHRHAPPPDILDFVPDAPKELAQLITQLLAKDPLDRPPTAHVVANTLRLPNGSQPAWKSLA